MADAQQHPTEPRATYRDRIGLVIGISLIVLGVILGVPQDLNAKASRNAAPTAEAPTTKADLCQDATAARLVALQTKDIAGARRWGEQVALHCHIAKF